MLLVKTEDWRQTYRTAFHGSDAQSKGYRDVTSVVITLPVFHPVDAALLEFGRDRIGA